MSNAATPVESNAIDVRSLLTIDGASAMLSALVSVVRSVGFEWCGAMTVVEADEGADLNHLHQLPPGFEPHYYNAAFPPGFSCPVLKHLKVSSAPLCWGPRVYAGRLQDRYQLQRQFGLSAGVALAVHRLGGQHVVVGMETSEVGWLAESRRCHEASHLISRLAHSLQDKLLATMATVQSAPTSGCRAEVSRIEADLLRWTLDGSSLASQSRAIRKDDKTVLYHLDNVSRRLGASNKWHAAAVAFSQGLIT
jgi:DNA-binding CsgD family transcriptional regulator